MPVCLPAPRSRPLATGNTDDDRIVPDGRGRRRPIGKRSELGIEAVAEIEDAAAANRRSSLPFLASSENNRPSDVPWMIRRSPSGLPSDQKAQPRLTPPEARACSARVFLERIELPELFAGGRIEGHHAQIPGRHVHHTVDHDRRALDRLAFLANQLAGVISPDRFESLHGLTIDLSELGIPHAAGVIPDTRPVSRAPRLFASVASAGKQPGDCDET